MNSRFSLAAHMLGMIAWTEREHSRPATSDELAASIGTHPVVIRRILSQLAVSGLVSCRRGAGGGTVLARDPKTIDLRQVHEAVADDGSILGSYPAAPTVGCNVGPVISEYLGEVLGDAEAALLQRLSRVSVDTMSRAIVERMRRRASRVA